MMIKISDGLSLSVPQIEGLLDVLQALEEAHLNLANRYPDGDRENVFNKGAAEAMFSLGEAIVQARNEQLGNKN